jgi:hypothetical protein
VPRRAAVPDAAFAPADPPPSDLTGSYDADWNAGLTSMEAASLISLSTAVVYTVPFLGGMLADQYWGDDKTILAGETAAVRLRCSPL